MDTPAPDPIASDKSSGAERKAEVNGDKFLSALKFGVVTQMVLFVLTALVMDCGVLNREFTAGMIGYWLAVGIIMVRRREAPTTGDILFLRYGNFGLLVAGPFIATFVYWVIGKSVQSGLERLF